MSLSSFCSESEGFEIKKLFRIGYKNNSSMDSKGDDECEDDVAATCLDGQTFLDLVSDIKNNSRLPNLGNDLEVPHNITISQSTQETGLCLPLPNVYGPGSSPRPTSLSSTTYGKNEYPEGFPGSYNYIGSRRQSGYNSCLSLDLGDLNLNLRSKSILEEPKVSRATSCNFSAASDPNIQSDEVEISDENDKYNANHFKMERTLVLDLLLIFQGCNGTILQSSENNCFAFYTDEIRLHPAQKMLALRMCPIGVCYNMIKSQLFVSSRGKCFEALKSRFQGQLREFDLMVLSLEQMMLGRTASEDLEKYRKIVPFGSEGITLHQLECLFFDSKKILKAMTSMLSHIKPGMEGGPLCSVLHEFTHHGDPEIQEFAYQTLAFVARPIYKMIGNWIFLGSFHDKYDEFFIRVDPTCPIENMWRGKFTLVQETIPSFITPTEAKLIFRAGKNLNFLTEVCKCSDVFFERRLFQLYRDIDIENALREPDSLFSDLIKTVFTLTSDQVLKEVVTYGKLFEHLHTIKYYILQGQGDFFQLFISKNRDQLEKAAKSINMQAMQETLHNTLLGATHLASPEYLAQVVVTRAPRSETLKIWDIFCLEYKPSQCLGQVLTEDTMKIYSRLFSFLWQSLRVETIVKSMWMDKRIFNMKVLRVIPEISATVFRNNVLIGEFNHFVIQVRYYAMSEAVETEWQKLMESLMRMTCLEDIITAHEHFIEVINIRCLQNRAANSILLLLESIYNQIFAMEKYYNEFCTRVTHEYTRRTDTSSFTSPELKEFVLRDFRKYLEDATTTIENLQVTSRELVQSFLLAAENYVDDMYTNINLSGFCYRVDFNNFYSDRNSKLMDAKTLKNRLSEMNLSKLGGSMTEISSSAVKHKDLESKISTNSISALW